MTAMHAVYLASALGAVLFFAAGLFTHALRHPIPETIAAAAPPPPTILHAVPLAPPEDDARVATLRAELEHTRAEVAITARDRDAHDRRARDAEARSAEQARALRELATETERMRGRVADAEALRADYVRLRTVATDGDYLKTEVARLERELRDARISALNAAPRNVSIAVPRAAVSAAATTMVAHGNAHTNVAKPAVPELPSIKRGPAQPATGAIAIAAAAAHAAAAAAGASGTGGPPSIGEALGGALARFADADTRASAVADALGFPLAATGDDGAALAAYGALLLDAAQRAGQFLPIARPVAIELVDERGAHVAAYAFDVDADRLMLVNLAVAGVESTRLDPTLVELATILTPSERPGRRPGLS